MCAVGWKTNDDNTVFNDYTPHPYFECVNSENWQSSAEELMR